MTTAAKNELFEVQKKYDNGELLFQEFKDKSIALIVAHSDIQDIENLVANILEN